MLGKTYNDTFPKTYFFIFVSKNLSGCSQLGFDSTDFFLNHYPE